MIVSLETQRGEFVREIDIPPFVEAPNVLMWGTRVFLKTNENRYQETTYYVVPQIGGV